MFEHSQKFLNQAVSDELAAVHQYMYFHFHLADQGFGPLSLLLKRTAIEEMLHIELLAERILMLKGEVEIMASGPVEKITEPADILAKAFALEQKAIMDYNRFAQECAQGFDSASKALFEQLVKDEERHWDQFDKQAENIKRFGMNYLALQSFSGGPADPGQPGAGTAAAP